eukprot:evm.model.scf_359.6 EVM.evm.TU.scf_359.6   scf_359:28323-37645(+)
MTYAADGAEATHREDGPRTPREGDHGASTPSSEGHRTDDNFKVIVRVRPPLLRELNGVRPYQHTVCVDPSARKIILSENVDAITQAGGPPKDGYMYATYDFTFDRVYDQDDEQEEIYRQSARDSVLSVLEGYNTGIIAYGQTGTGKTYTMEGTMDGSERGIIPRAVEDIFSCIENDPDPSSKYLVRASYLQIYNDIISDLLKEGRHNLLIREDHKRGVYVEGLSEWVVRSPSEVYSLMEQGAQQRATGTTKMNEISSRSHAILIIIVEKSTLLHQESNIEDGKIGGVGWRSQDETKEAPRRVKVGKLNLVDLAGSERVHVTGATGKRLEESKKINQSLSALGNVIAALTDQRPRAHIPYRDSKVTRILEDSVGGNCRTTMICLISPALESFAESVSTLKFANRAKRIRNEAHVNEDLDQRTLLRKYERELRRLKSELKQRSKDLVDKRKLLEVEEQKRRAERDKLAAITALEKRSREFMREKTEKRRLETRISGMQSQLLFGGKKLEDSPAFRNLLAKEHRRMRGEYEGRLRELERERQSVEQDRAQVDHYKSLLLKQRDIMIALTARLNERDEQLLALQEELDAVEKHQRQLEDVLDHKTSELIHLRKAAVEHTTTSTTKDTALGSALGEWKQVDEFRESLGRNGYLENIDNDQNSSPSRDGQPSMVNQLEDRVASLKQQHEHLRKDVEARLEEKNHLIESTRQENRQLRELLSRSSGSPTSFDPISAREVQSLREQCNIRKKEREALKTILNSKMKRMVDDVACTIKDYGHQEQAHSRLMAQVQALGQLLNATVGALGLSDRDVASRQ